MKENQSEITKLVSRLVRLESKRKGGDGGGGGTGGCGGGWGGGWVNRIQPVSLVFLPHHDGSPPPASRESLPI